VLVRALGYGTNEQIKELFGDDERINATLKRITPPTLTKAA